MQNMSTLVKRESSHKQNKINSDAHDEVLNIHDYTTSDDL